MKFLPIHIILRDPNYSTKPGGVEFINCVIEDDQDRPFIAYRTGETGPIIPNPTLCDITGNVNVTNPYGVWTDFGPDIDNVNLLINDVPIIFSPVGDLDGNYKVDWLDFNLLAGNWRAEGSLVGDLNLNFTVDTPDVGMMVENWLVDCVLDPNDLACQ